MYHTIPQGVGAYGLGSQYTKWLAYTHMLNVTLNVALYSCYVLVTRRSKFI